MTPCHAEILITVEICGVRLTKSLDKFHRFSPKGCLNYYPSIILVCTVVANQHFFHPSKIIHHFVPLLLSSLIRHFNCLPKSSPRFIPKRTWQEMETSSQVLFKHILAIKTEKIRHYYYFG